MRKLSPASVALLRRVGPFFAALLRLRPRSVAPSRFPLTQERAGVAAPVKARASTSPSPLNGGICLAERGSVTRSRFNAQTRSEKGRRIWNSHVAAGHRPALR